MILNPFSDINYYMQDEVFNIDWPGSSEYVRLIWKIQMNPWNILGMKYIREVLLR